MNGIGDFLKAQLLMQNQNNLIFNFMILAIIDIMTGFTKKMADSFEKYFTKYIDDKFKKVEIHLEQKVGVSDPHSLYFERNYKNSGLWDRADAILCKITGIPASQTFLIVDNLQIIMNRQPFLIEKDIYFQLIICKQSEEKVEKIEFKVYSNSLNVCEIKEYINRITEEYIIDKKNNLGDKLYFFDQVSQSNKKRGDYVNKLLFTMHQFNSNRNLENVFHERQEEVKNRVNFFMNNKEWYDTRGIPYTLGFLFTGSAGVGKTSSLKAIANVCKRHIININMAEITDKKRLKKLFYDERINICKNPEAPSQNEELIIPINKRLYVIEDIDAMNSKILLKRNSNETETSTILIKPKKTGNTGMSFSHEEEDETVSDVDLSTVLNIMDGSLETPGRILIVSTNYPEKLDDAFIRPGRIDMIVEFKKANRQVIIDMMTSFYGSKLNFDRLKETEVEIDYKWTPAEISQLLFKNFNNPEQAIDDILNLNQDYQLKK